MLNEIHQQFIAVVRAGRGKRLKETPETFSGLYWTGARAVDMGLADAFGTVDTVARDIVRRVPETQVWIVDRREQALEDTSVFATFDPQRAQDYYLGFQYKRTAGEDAKYAARWGLKLQLADLRSVIRRARVGGRRVFLGGHSAGASTAVAYAAWDFGGRPGYRDLDGLVLIDGGLLGSFASADLTRAKRELADIRTGKICIQVARLFIGSM